MGLPDFSKGMAGTLFPSLRGTQPVSGSCAFYPAAIYFHSIWKFATGNTASQRRCRPRNHPGPSGTWADYHDTAVLPGIESEGAKGLLQGYRDRHATYPVK